MSRIRASMLLALAVFGGIPLPALAHDPAQHGFSLVVFEPSFTAPDFTVESLDGKPTRLSDFRGHHVLLNFWATWCPPCLHEMPSMEALYQSYSARGLVVVAVSSDREGADIVRRFLDKLDVTFPVLLDPEGRVSMRYGARNLPLSFIVDPNGEVVAAAQGARDWASAEARSVIDEMLPRE